MSGGHFDYQDFTLKDTIFGYADKPKNVFEDREISELVWDVFDLIHDFDLYYSGDTGEDDWIRSKEAFKAKWLKTAPDERIKRIVDNSIIETKQELYKTFLPSEVLSGGDT